MIVITYILCCGILIFAIIEYHWLRSCNIEFDRILSNFNNGSIVEKHTVKLNNEQSINYDDNISVVRRTNLAEDTNYHIDKLDRNKEIFYEQFAKYVSYSQLVSLFPLLGILGTVAGLAFSAKPDAISELISGLGTALYTTLTGLIASIFLKYYDSTQPGKKVYEIEAKFDAADSAIQRRELVEELRKTSKE